MQTSISPLHDRNLVTPLIKNIMRAQSMIALFPTGPIKKQYREAIKQLHPDLCTNPKAEAALIRLNELRLQHEKGIVIADDAGSIWTHKKAAIFRGDLGILNNSYQQYLNLKNFHIKKPNNMGYTNWSRSAYANLKADYSKKSTNAIFKSNTTRKVADDLNPYGLTFRESRDSTAHPNSLAIGVFLDVTGSMRNIPEQLIRHL